MARMLWAFNVEAGINETTGERHKLDDMDCTEGFVTLSKSFGAVYHPQGQWVRDAIAESGTTHDLGHAAILDGAKKEGAKP